MLCAAARGNSSPRLQAGGSLPHLYEALYTHLRESTTTHGVGYYHVIHFDMHGGVLSYDDYSRLQEELPPSPHMYKDTSRYGRPPILPFTGKKAFLSFEGATDDTADLVEASELASLLTEHHIPIAILNACQSGKQVGIQETSLGSRLMAYGTQMVLAMGYSVTVSAAQLLMETLYKQLFEKHDLATSIRDARQELYNRKQRRAYFNEEINLEDWLLPVVYQNQPQNLTVREFTSEEASVYYRKQAEREREKPGEPRYGFVRRDIDILQLEKRLLIKRNIVLVRGMAGSGKTTLLQHLRSWWQTTGLIDKTFYFGYDERAWNRQQILTEIAQKLLTPTQYSAAFQPLPLDAQQAMLAQRLRSERHLLILDNLESITGTQLAIQHTLPQEDQQDLHHFLVALAGGKTLVLLGSRSSEGWLAEQTFADNIYDLPGLDAEAASTLTEHILEHHNVTKYRTDPDLQHLLKLLNGFPLALEVVLGNLAHQAPKEILEALQAGNIDLDKGDTQKKTNSIMLCIGASYNNLSPDAQQLLLCLAPFTAVINLYALEEYTHLLQQQPALSYLPFKRLPEVMQATQNWGLLRQDPNIPYYLHLQPVLSYFLRNCLSVPEHAKGKTAIGIAFRQHYHNAGATLGTRLQSKEASARLSAQVVTKMEYENLMTALLLALDTQVSFFYICYPLFCYLDTTQDHRRALELGQCVLQRVGSYPEEKLRDELAEEFAILIHSIATTQLALNQYTEAEASYRQLLEIWLANKIVDEKHIRCKSALIYHNLGVVTQKQRLWEQAKDYYQQALQINVEYHDRYAQAGNCHELGTLSQEQGYREQARAYFLHALETYSTVEETYKEMIVMGSLSRLWKVSEDTQLLAAVASIYSRTPEEVGEEFRKYLQKMEKDEGKG